VSRFFLRLSLFISNHLLLVSAFFFALGISCALACKVTPGHIFLFPLLTGVSVLLTRLRGQTRATLLLLLPFIASLGFVHSILAGREPADHHIFHLIQQEQEAVLICTLDRLPGFNGEKSTLVVDSHSLRLKDSPGDSAARGLVQLKLKGPWPKELLPGDQLAIRAQLDRPHSFRNPGGFDYPTFLSRENIWITGRISSPLHIYRLQQSPTLSHRIRYLPERLRSRISSFIEQTAAPEISSVYKALLIGEASGITQEILEAFKGSGCMHILSISGAHLSILATFLFFILYWLLRRSEYLILRYPVKKIAAGICLLPLTLYTLLAGANTPVIRSLIMVSVFMLALCADKLNSLFNALGIAALLILIWDPVSLFTASFQLSFMAVACIAAVAPLLTRITKTEKNEASLWGRITKRSGQFILASLIVSLAVTIGTTPLLLYYFNRISVVGLVANLPIESLICFWSLPLGFLACPLIFISPPIAALLLHLGGYGLTLSLKMATFINDLPFATLWLPTPPPILITFYYATIIIVISGTLINKTTRILAACSCFLGLFFFIMPLAELFKGQIKTSEITFLDVGQGSSTFLQIPAGKRVLIDGGNSSYRPEFNPGEHIIAPFLWHKGIKKLDAIIITHADADHYNGVPFLLQHFRPETLWVNELTGHDDAWRQMLALADRLHIQVKIPQPGEHLIKSEEATLINLGNPIENSSFQSNDRSLILRFEDRTLSCLFVGDISQNIEKQLVASNLPLQAKLLLSPHHGSSTSNSESFLKNVSPQTIVVSAGRFRPDHFPATEVRQRCAEMGIKLLTTASHGAITCSEDKGCDQGWPKDKM
jgi:competence protein ComEC